MDVVLIFPAELTEECRPILGPQAFLVDPVHQAPALRRMLRVGVGGLLGGQIVAREIDDLLWRVLMPITQQREAKTLVHEPLDLEVVIRVAKTRAPFDEAVVPLVVGRVLLLPDGTELSEGNELRVGPSLYRPAHPPLKGGTDEVFAE